MTRKLNFASGPATLPEPVLRRAQAALWDLDGSGIGVLEHSHRGKAFRAVIERTTAAIREVAGIGDDFAVLFLTAGATHHFTMVPHNFLGEGDTADVCHSGVWTTKAMTEIRRFGKAHVACTSEPAFDATPGPPVYSARKREIARSQRTGRRTNSSGDISRQCPAVWTGIRTPFISPMSW